MAERGLHTEEVIVNVKEQGAEAVIRQLEKIDTLINKLKSGVDININANGLDKLTKSNNYQKVFKDIGKTFGETTGKQYQQALTDNVSGIVKNSEGFKKLESNLKNQASKIQSAFNKLPGVEKGMKPTSENLFSILQNKDLGQEDLKKVQDFYTEVKKAQQTIKSAQKQFKDFGLPFDLDKEIFGKDVLQGMQSFSKQFEKLYPDLSVNDKALQTKLAKSSKYYDQNIRGLVDKMGEQVQKEVEGFANKVNKETGADKGGSNVTSTFTIEGIESEFAKLDAKIAAYQDKKISVKLEVGDGEQKGVEKTIQNAAEDAADKAADKATQTATGLTKGKTEQTKKNEADKQRAEQSQQADDQKKSAQALSQIAKNTDTQQTAKKESNVPQSLASASRNNQKLIDDAVKDVAAKYTDWKSEYGSWQTKYKPSASLYEKTFAFNESIEGLKAVLQRSAFGQYKAGNLSGLRSDNGELSYNSLVQGLTKLQNSDMDKVLRANQNNFKEFVAAGKLDEARSNRKALQARIDAINDEVSQVRQSNPEETVLGTNIKGVLKTIASYDTGNEKSLKGLYEATKRDEAAFNALTQSKATDATQNAKDIIQANAKNMQDLRLQDVSQVGKLLQTAINDADFATGKTTGEFAMYGNEQDERFGRAYSAQAISRYLQGLERRDNSLFDFGKQKFNLEIDGKAVEMGFSQALEYINKGSGLGDFIKKNTRKINALGYNSAGEDARGYAGKQTYDYELFQEKAYPQYYDSKNELTYQSQKLKGLRAIAQEQANINATAKSTEAVTKADVKNTQDKAEAQTTVTSAIKDQVKSTEAATDASKTAAKETQAAAKETSAAIKDTGSYTPTEKRYNELSSEYVRLQGEFKELGRSQIAHMDSLFGETKKNFDLMGSSGSIESKIDYALEAKRLLNNFENIRNAFSGVENIQQKITNSAGETIKNTTYGEWAKQAHAEVDKVISAYQQKYPDVKLDTSWQKASSFNDDYVSRFQERLSAANKAMIAVNEELANYKAIPPFKYDEVEKSQQYLERMSKSAAKDSQGESTIVSKPQSKGAESVADGTKATQTASEITSAIEAMPSAKEVAINVTNTGKSLAEIQAEAEALASISSASATINAGEKGSSSKGGSSKDTGSKKDSGSSNNAAPIQRGGLPDLATNTSTRGELLSGSVNKFGRLEDALVLRSSKEHNPNNVVATYDNLSKKQIQSGLDFWATRQGFTVENLSVNSKNGGSFSLVSKEGKQTNFQVDHFGKVLEDLNNKDKFVSMPAMSQHGTMQGRIVDVAEDSRDKTINNLFDHLGGLDRQIKGMLEIKASNARLYHDLGGNEKLDKLRLDRDLTKTSINKLSNNPLSDTKRLNNAKPTYGAYRDQALREIAAFEDVQKTINDLRARTVDADGKAITDVLSNSRGSRKNLIDTSERVINDTIEKVRAGIIDPKSKDEMASLRKTLATESRKVEKQNLEETTPTVRRKEWKQENPLLPSEMKEVDGIVKNVTNAIGQLKDLPADFETTIGGVKQNGRNAIDRLTLSALADAEALKTGNFDDGLKVFNNLRKTGAQFENIVASANKTLDSVATGVKGEVISGNVNKYGTLENSLTLRSSREGNPNNVVATYDNLSKKQIQEGLNFWANRQGLAVENLSVNSKNGGSFSLVSKGGKQTNFNVDSFGQVLQDLNNKDTFMSTPALSQKGTMQGRLVDVAEDSRESTINNLFDHLGGLDRQIKGMLDVRAQNERLYADLGGDKKLDRLRLDRELTAESVRKLSPNIQADEQRLQNAKPQYGSYREQMLREAEAFDDVQKKIADLRARTIDADGKEITDVLSGGRGSRKNFIDANEKILNDTIQQIRAGLIDPKSAEEAKAITKRMTDAGRVLTRLDNEETTPAVKQKEWKQNNPLLGSELKEINSIADRVRGFASALKDMPEDYTTIFDGVKMSGQALVDRLTQSIFGNVEALQTGRYDDGLKLLGNIRKESARLEKFHDEVTTDNTSAKVTAAFDAKKTQALVERQALASGMRVESYSTGQGENGRYSGKMTLVPLAEGATEKYQVNVQDMYDFYNALDKGLTSSANPITNGHFDIGRMAADANKSIVDQKAYLTQLYEQYKTNKLTANSLKDLQKVNPDAFAKINGEEQLKDLLAFNKQVKQTITDTVAGLGDNAENIRRAAQRAASKTVNASKFDLSDDEAARIENMDRNVSAFTKSLSQTKGGAEALKEYEIARDRFLTAPTKAAAEMFSQEVNRTYESVRALHGRANNIPLFKTAAEKTVKELAEDLGLGFSKGDSNKVQDTLVAAIKNAAGVKQNLRFSEDELSNIFQSSSNNKLVANGQLNPLNADVQALFGNSDIKMVEAYANSYAKLNQELTSLQELQNSPNKATQDYIQGLGGKDYIDQLAKREEGARKNLDKAVSISKNQNDAREMARQAIFDYQQDFDTPKVFKAQLAAMFASADDMVSQLFDEKLFPQQARIAGSGKDRNELNNWLNQIAHLSERISAGNISNEDMPKELEKATGHFANITKAFGDETAQLAKFGHYLDSQKIGNDADINKLVEQRARKIATDLEDQGITTKLGRAKNGRQTIDYTDKEGNQVRRTVTARSYAGQDGPEAGFYQSDVTTAKESTLAGWAKGFKSKFSSISQYLGSMLFMQAGIQQIRQGWQFVQELDKGLTNIGMTMSASNAQLKDLGRTAIQTGKNLSADSLDVMSAMTVYANASETADSIAKKSESVVKLANASGAATSTAADWVQGVTNQFTNLAGQEEQIINSYEKISAGLPLDFASGINTMAEAVSNSGSVARDAGLDFEEYAAMVGTVASKTRQEGSTIGNTLKTTMARISRSKTADDDVKASDRSNAAKAFGSIGIDLYDSNGAYKDLSETLAELHDRWNDMTDAQKNYISEQAAGTRGVNIFRTLMDSYDEYMGLAQSALQDTTYADSVQKRHENSVQGAKNRLTASVQGVWNDALSSDAMGFVYDTGNTLISMFSGLGSAMGTVAREGTRLVGGDGIAETVGGFTNLLTTGATLYSLFSTFSAFKETKGARKTGELSFGGALASSARKGFQPFFSLKDGLSNLLFGKKGTLSREQIGLPSVATTADEAIMRELGKTNASLYGQQTLGLVSLFNKSDWGKISMAFNAGTTFNKSAGSEGVKTLKEVFTSTKGQGVEGFAQRLGALYTSIGGLPGLLAGGALAGGAVLGTMLVSTSMNHREDTMERLNKQLSEYQERMKNIRTGQQFLKDNASEYERLAGGVNLSTNRNISLTNDEYQRYLELTNQIASIAPTMISGYDSMGNAILGTKTAMYGLNEALAGQSLAAASSILGDGGRETIYDALRKTYDTGYFGRGGIEGILTGISTAYNTINKAFKFDVNDVFDSSVKNTEDLVNAGRDIIGFSDFSDLGRREFLKQFLKDTQDSIDMSYEALSKKYGDDNAAWLALQLQNTDAAKPLTHPEDKVFTENEIATRTQEARTVLQERLAEISGSVNEAMQGYLAGLEAELNIARYSKEFDDTRITNKDWTNLSSLLGGMDAVQAGKNESEGISARSLVNNWAQALSDKQTGARLSKALENVLSINTRTTFSELMDMYEHDLPTIAGLVRGESIEGLQANLGLEDLTEMSSLYKDIQKDINNATKATKGQNKELKNTNSAIKDNQRALKKFVDDNNINTRDEMARLADIIKSQDPSQLAGLLSNKARGLESLWNTKGFDISSIDDTTASMKENISTWNEFIDGMWKYRDEALTSNGLSFTGREFFDDMFSGIPQFDADKLFEETALGIRMNAEYFDELNKLYKDNYIDDLNRQIEKEIQQYQDLSRAIYNASSEAERQQLITKRDAVEKGITEHETLRNGFLADTNYLREFERAVSGSERSDVYDWLVTNITGKNDKSGNWQESIVDEMYNAGKVGTQAFKKGVQMMTTEDLTGKTVGEYVAVYEERAKDFKKLFQDGTAGMAEGVRRLNQAGIITPAEGEEAGGVIMGTLDEITEALGTSREAAQVWLENYMDYGAVIPIMEVSDRFQKLRDDAIEAAKAVGMEDVDMKNLNKLEDIQNVLDRVSKARTEKGINEDQISNLAKMQTYLETLAGTLYEPEIELKGNAKNQMEDLLDYLGEVRESTLQEYSLDINADTSVEDLAKQLSGLKDNQIKGLLDGMVEAGIIKDDVAADLYKQILQIIKEIEDGDYNAEIEVDATVEPKNKEPDFEQLAKERGTTPEYERSQYYNNGGNNGGKTGGGSKEPEKTPEKKEDDGFVGPKLPEEQTQELTDALDKNTKSTDTQSRNFEEVANSRGTNPEYERSRYWDEKGPVEEKKPQGYTGEEHTTATDIKNRKDASKKEKTYEDNPVVPSMMKEFWDNMAPNKVKSLFKDAGVELDSTLAKSEQIYDAWEKMTDEQKTSLMEKSGLNPEQAQMYLDVMDQLVAKHKELNEVRTQNAKRNDENYDTSGRGMSPEGAHDLEVANTKQTLKDLYSNYKNLSPDQRRSIEDVLGRKISSPEDLLKGMSGLSEDMKIDLLLTLGVDSSEVESTLQNLNDYEVRVKIKEAENQLASLSENKEAEIRAKYNIGDDVDFSNMDSVLEWFSTIGQYTGEQFWLDVGVNASEIEGLIESLREAKRLKDQLEGKNPNSETPVVGPAENLIGKFTKAGKDLEASQHRDEVYGMLDDAWNKSGAEKRSQLLPYLSEQAQEAGQSISELTFDFNEFWYQYRRASNDAQRRKLLSNWGIRGEDQNMALATLNQKQEEDHAYTVGRAVEKGLNKEYISKLQDEEIDVLINYKENGQLPEVPEEQSIVIDYIIKNGESFNAQTAQTAFEQGKIRLPEGFTPDMSEFDWNVLSGMTYEQTVQFFADWSTLGQPPIKTGEAYYVVTNEDELYQVGADGVVVNVTLQPTNSIEEVVGVANAYGADASITDNINMQSLVGQTPKTIQGAINWVSEIKERPGGDELLANGTIFYDAEAEQLALQTADGEVIYQNVWEKLGTQFADGIINYITGSIEKPTGLTVNGIINWVSNLSGNFSADAIEYGLNDGGRFTNGTFTYGYNRGTAFAEGTEDTPAKKSLWGRLKEGAANAYGNWGSRTSGNTMVGELGRELVVRGSKWFTVGDRGPEMAKIKRGDIIFNHKQTEDILNDGKTKMRGKLIGGDSAFAHGNAFSAGTGNNIAHGTTPQFGYGGAKNTNMVTGETTSGNISQAANSLQQAAAATNYAAGNAAAQQKNWNDWIERLFKAIDRKLTEWDHIIDNTFITFDKRAKARSEEFVDIWKNEIPKYQEAIAYYDEHLKGLGLADEYVEKIKNGTIEVQDIQDENLKQQISDYMQFYDARMDAEDKIYDLQQKQRDLASQQFQNIMHEYDQWIDGLRHTVTVIDKKANVVEAKGHFVGEEFYRQAQQEQKKVLSAIEDQWIEANARLQNELNSGMLEMDSEEYRDRVADIQKIEEAWYDVDEALYQYTQRIYEARDALFQFKQAMIDEIHDENDFYRQLISLNENDLFDPQTGRMNVDAFTVGALHASDYQLSMQQAAQYAEKIAEIDKQLQDDKWNPSLDSKTLLEQRQKYVKAQRESILAAADEKKAIQDLYRNQYDRMLKALDKVIAKRKELLQAEKDAYDYSWNIKQQSQNLNDLEKQLRSIQNDDSEEAKARRTSLQRQIEEAQHNLEASEYDKWLQDQNAMMDKAAEQWEEIFDMRINDIEGYLSDMINFANGEEMNSLIANQGRAADLLEKAMGESNGMVYQRLNEVGEKYSYEMSQEMETIWGSDGPPLMAFNEFTGQLFSKDGGLPAILKVLQDISNYVETNLTQNDPSKVGPGIKSNTQNNAPHSSSTKDYGYGEKPSKIHPSDLAKDKQIYVEAGTKFYDNDQNVIGESSSSNTDYTIMDYDYEGGYARIRPTNDPNHKGFWVKIKDIVDFNATPESAKQPEPEPEPQGELVVGGYADGGNAPLYQSATGLGQVARPANWDGKYRIIQDYGDYVLVAPSHAPYQAVGFMKKSDLKPVTMETGGYTGDYEGLAYLHKKEQVLSAAQTEDWHKLVNDIMPMALDLFKPSNTDFDSIGNRLLNLFPAATNNSGPTEVNFNLPNVTNAEEFASKLPDLIRQDNRIIKAVEDIASYGASGKSKFHNRRGIMPK